jgi:serine/threonine protein kinase
MAAANYCGRCLTTFTGEPPACTNMSCGSNQPEDGWDTVLDDGDILDRHYLIERCLAVGGAGLTYKARELDADNTPIGPDLAIKVLFAARDKGAFLQRLSNEAQILQSLAHPHIVACHGFVTRVGHAPYLVTRFERGGGLQEHIERVGPVRPSIAAAIAHQILTGLDKAHRAGVVHRDLKPDNVLLEEPVSATQVPHVRVADFGIAKIQAGIGDRLTRVGMFVGTPEYAAPEQFSGADPTAATDVFAMGGLILFCLTGELPVHFSQRTDLPTTYQELLDQLPPQIPSSVPDNDAKSALQILINNIMTQYPEDRLTVPEVLVALAPIAGIPVEESAHPIGKTATSNSASPRSSPASAPTPMPAAEGPPETEPKAGPTAQPVVPDAAPPQRSNGAVAAVGAMGMLAVAALVVLAAIGGGAWYMGAFDGESVPTPQLTADVGSERTGIFPLDGATAPELVAERTRLADAVASASGGIHLVCAIDGDIPVRLTVSETGSIAEALVNPASGLSREQRSCVDTRLTALSVPRSETYSVTFTTTLFTSN